ncbi:ABC transporter substrate-binding protein [Streptomyces sp. A7024]|uniref:ABC transporter substrate-binding protein n=1 Tax=Streptomyces coryli TaxID=1128680 RepID=A0A6G4U7C8_9ACTN|nr:ABC transporter substrate-binding protein [Streptomyces coryli]NGN67902.1 ABC transporter substrate-binding protein [Streptomyces coryli]
MTDIAPSDISRRRLFQIMGLGTVAAVGVPGLAACSKADPEDDKNKTGEFHGAYPFNKPPAGHFNRGGGPIGLAPVAMYLIDGPYSDLIHSVGAYWDWAQKKFVYYLAESSEFNDDFSTFTVKLRSGLKWSNGKPLTSKDYMTTMYVQWIQNSPAWGSIEKIEAPDEQTFVVHLKSPAAIIDRYILKSSVIDTGTYGEWADKAATLVEAGEKTTGKKAVALNKDFNKFRPKEIIASGPFMVDDKLITSSKMTLVKNKHGFRANEVKFEKIILFNGETPDVAPLVESKDVDYATHGFTPAQEKSFENAGYRIMRPPTYSGPALFINHDKVKAFSDRRARQALAYAIKRDEAGKVALGESGKAVRYMAGFSDVMVQDWISAADQKKLARYEHDTDKAEKLLTEAGWKKSGGKWQTPQGKTAKFVISFPSDFADWAACAENIAEQLKEFGIELVQKGQKFESYNPEIDKGNFELCIQAWGASQHPHPHFSFAADLFIHNIPIARNAGGRGMGFELKVDTEETGKIDLEKVVNMSGEGLNEDEQKKNVTAAALAFNDLLPIIPIFERYGNNPVLEGPRVKKFPGDAEPIMQNAPYGDNAVVMGLLDSSITP